MNFFKLLIGLGLAGLMTGCSTSGDITAINPVSQKHVEEAELKLAKHHAQNHHLMSPYNYEEAAEHIEDAREALNSGASHELVHKHIDEAQRQMGSINENVKISKLHLKRVLDARAQAVEEGAQVLDSFKEADEELVDLAKRIELKYIDSAIAYADRVESQFRDAEIEAIQSRELGTANKNKNLAMKLEGVDNFDQELRVVEENIASAAQIIAKNKDNPERYRPAVLEAERTSLHLLALAETAEWLEKTPIRDVTFKLEKDLESLRKPLGSEKMTFYNYDQKITVLRAEVETVPWLKSELTAAQLDAIYQKRARKWANRANDALSTELSMRKDLQRKVDEVRSLFSKNEAQVVVKGDDLVLRLVGLNFDVNQAKLPENADTLLGKVIKSVEKFDADEIEIAGHADATGDSLYNEELSRRRALAVNKFIVGNSSLDNTETRVTGYGFRNPIAQNKTAEGRAKNRRIDIVLNSVLEKL